MDDDLVDAARRVLFASVGTRKQEHPELRQLGEFLLRYSLYELSSRGEIVRCSEEDRPDFEYGPPRDRMRRDGIREYALYDDYDRAWRRAGGLAHAQINLELLYRVMPECWVPIVASLIADGPAIAARRAYAAIYDYSKEPVKANRRRAAATRSRSSVVLALTEARRLFSLVHSLRTLPACQDWIQEPHLDMPEVPEGGYKVVGPRPEAVRQTWLEKTTDIHERLGVNSIEEEMAALNSLTDQAAYGLGLWRLSRDRVILLLLLLTAGRCTALARLTRKDYVRDCEGPPPDRRRGAAIDLVPRKSKGRDEVRRKPITEGAALVIDFYIAVTDRMAVAKGRAPAPPDAPLLVAKMGQLDPVQARWLSLRVAGTSERLPLIPRDRCDTPEHVTDEERAYCGYTMHEFRHGSNQLAERAGQLWNDRHPATGSEVNPPISYYAAALLDNGGVEKDLRALYADRSTPEMLEVVSGRAAAIMWEILTTDAGLRKRPNLEIYVKEMTLLRKIEDEERRLEQEAKELQDKYGGGQQELSAPPSIDGDPLREVVYFQKALNTSMGELREIVLKSSAITHKLVQLSREKAEKIARLDMFRLDQTTWLPVPDSEPPGAEHVDWIAIDRGELGRPLIPNDTPTAVRDWLTILEFCEIAELEARSTLTRWINGEHIPTRPDKRPWEPDQVPVDDSLGRNYRRILVPGVHDAFWRTSLMRDKLTETLGRWPREQGWTTKDGEPTPRCYEPIRVSPARPTLIPA